jgi:uncharacterized membrane protein
LKNRRSKGIVFVLLVLVVTLLTGCIGFGKTYQLTIAVLGEDDLPLEGAHVVIGKETKVTDAAGKVVFELRLGVVKVEVSAEGYQAQSKPLVLLKHRAGTIRMVKK